ncbi:MAG: MTAP family purine nucleoside phosphorylase [Thermoplasmatota archaeon]
MSGIGVIGGTSFKRWDSFNIIEEIDRTTPWGSPSSSIMKGDIDGKEIFLLLRHGESHDIPPHRINNRANIYALQRHVDEIIGISSAGALKENIDVPSISIPKDYVNFWGIQTFYDEKIKHITPSLSTNLREELITACEKIGKDVRKKDVYVKTEGPRLETKAEVKILKNFGDIVGMTLPPEATLCKEANVKYNCIVTIDNFAHGIGPEKVDYKDIVSTARNNWDQVKEILERFLKDR